MSSDPSTTPAETSPPAGASWTERIPPGAAWMATGTVISAAGGLLFLIIADHSLSPGEYSALALAWVAMFTVAGGLLGPLEQELARSCRARIEEGAGIRPLFDHYAVLAFGAVGAVALVAIVSYPFAGRELFDGRVIVLVGLVLGLFGQACLSLCRGLFTTTRRFGLFAALLVGDSLLRLAAGAAAVILLDEPLLALAAILGLPAIVMAAVFSPFVWRDVRPGRPADRRDLNTKLGWMVSSAALASVIVSGGPIVVALLDGGANPALPGAYFNAQLLSRMPLLPGQALIIAVLLQVTSLYSLGDRQGFRRAVSRSVQLAFGVGMAGVIGIALLGPWALDFLFAPEAGDINRVDQVILAVGTMAVLVASVMSISLAAALRHRDSTLSIAAGLSVAAVVIVASPADPARTTAIAALVASVVWGLVAVQALRRTRPYRPVEATTARPPAA